MTYYDFGPCTNERFGGLKDQMEKLGIVEVYQCLKDDYKINLFGDYSAEVSSFFQFEIDYCN